LHRIVSRVKVCEVSFWRWNGRRAGKPGCTVSTFRGGCYYGELVNRLRNQKGGREAGNGARVGGGERLLTRDSAIKASWWPQWPGV